MQSLSRAARGADRSQLASTGVVPSSPTLSPRMIRTRITLRQDEHAAAAREARRLGISLAELVRRALRAALPVDEDRPWMRYAGMVESGDRDSSRRIDELVYGRKD